MYEKKKKKVKRFRKKFNTRVIKSKETYSVEKIAELFGAHANSVGRWFKAGLKRIDIHLPYRVFGQHLIDFLNARNKARRHPCASNELFCCKCQLPRKPKNNIVCINISNCRTNIVGICEVCGTKINKTISPQKVDLYKNIFNTEAGHKKDLLECTNTCAIVGKKQGE